MNDRLDPSTGWPGARCQSPGVLDQDVLAVLHTAGVPFRTVRGALSESMHGVATVEVESFVYGVIVWVDGPVHAQVALQIHQG